MVFEPGAKNDEDDVLYDNAGELQTDRSATPGPASQRELLAGGSKGRAVMVGTEHAPSSAMKKKAKGFSPLHLGETDYQD